MSDDGMAWYSARIKEHVLAALAEPGEQLGEGRRERVGVAARHLPAGEYRLTVRDGGFDIEAAPVVPDSADVDALARALFVEFIGQHSPHLTWDSLAGTGSHAVWRERAARVLAVVGQGVTGECDHALAARELVRTLPGSFADALALVDEFARINRPAPPTTTEGKSDE